MGASTKGCAISKKDAKAVAAKAMLALITKPKNESKAKKKTAPVSKKPTKTQKQKKAPKGK